MPSLTDKVVVITGASGGIGRETALAFARERAVLVLADVNEEPLRELAEQIEADGGEAIAVPTDVSKRDEMERLMQAAVDRFARVDILLNNAGFGLGATIEQTSEEDFRSLWETNVLGVMFGMQAALRVMRRQESGHIISVSSAAGRIGYPGIGAYSATKSAVIAMTEALRAEVADAGIHVSVVLPIGTDTPFFETARSIDGVPVGPHGPVQSPKHVAERIVACARRPTVEVVPSKRLRLGIILNALFPALLAAIGRRAYRRIQQRRAAITTAAGGEQKEASRG